jgi:DNA-binding protein HU-beta
VNRGDIVEALHSNNRGAITYQEASRVLNIIINTIKAALVKGDDVKLQGFGTFSTTLRPPRRMQNIATGEPGETQARRNLKFKPSDEMRIILNR